MKKDRLKKDRFNVVEFFSFVEGQPRASWSDSFKAIEITDSPRPQQQFLIEEYHYSFMNAAYYICHFYSSGEKVREAFLAGLGKYLKAKKTKPREHGRMKTSETFDIILGTEASPFEGHQGYLQTMRFNDFVRPWYMAKEGERIWRNCALKR